MSKRTKIQKHLHMLKEISSIMSAMKNVALMETHKLARFLAHQHRVLENLEATALDFLSHYPELGYQAERPAAEVIVAIGSQRGFCGDFNEILVNAIHQHRRQATSQSDHLLIVGRRLASRLGKETCATASLDGPSVAEEVDSVLHRLMTALSGLQAQGEDDRLLLVKVLAHHEGEDKIGMRAVLPAPDGKRFTPHLPYPPLLNMAAPVFFSELARHYLWAQMHDVFYSSLMVENRRRWQHMEGAIRRMEQKADEMQRKHNMLRQEEITEEIEVIMLSNDVCITELSGAPPQGFDWRINRDRCGRGHGAAVQRGGR